jgi:hypothetical protein
MTLPLHYASLDSRRTSFRRWGWAVGGIGFVLGLLALPGITVRQVESEMDAVTGSMSWKTTWLGGFTTGPRFDISPLEIRLKRDGIPWTPSWQLLHNTHRNIFGRANCYECGDAPAILYLRPVNKEFTTASTDAQLLEFINVMHSGSEAERKAAVDEACDKGLQAMSVDPAE